MPRTDQQHLSGWNESLVPEGERDGSFVVKHDGKYEGGAAAGSLTVVRGSGTDALKSVEGAGTFRAAPAGSVRLNIAVD
jgi:hypothetical protein